jgi:carbon storage regulator
MLVLSRKRDSSIVIGEGTKQVRVTVLDVRGDRVRLGIDAARDVPVHRREVWERIRGEGSGIGGQESGSVTSD